MINFTVSGKDYKCPEGWGDITISQASHLFELIKAEIPEKLMDIYKAMSKNEPPDIDSITTEEQIKTFPIFYGKVITAMCGVEPEQVEKILSSNRTTFYQTYIEMFVIGLLFHPYDFTPVGLTGFEHKGEMYYFPETANIIGDERPMGNADAVEFTESADLQIYAQKSGNNFIYAANIVSILCRPKGEKYNEELSMDRAENLKELPMNIFYEVFFSLAEQWEKCKSDFLQFSQVEEILNKRQKLMPAV